MPGGTPRERKSEGLRCTEGVSPVGMGSVDARGCSSILTSRESWWKFSAGPSTVKVSGMWISSFCSFCLWILSQGANLSRCHGDIQSYVQADPPSEFPPALSLEQPRQGAPELVGIE